MVAEMHLEGGDARARATAESSGEIPGGGSWRVNEITEGGKVAHVVLVTVAPGVRKKVRIPAAKYGTPELRARFAKGAAAEVKKQWLEEQNEAPAKSAAPDPTKLTFKDVGTLWTSGDLARRFKDHVGTKKTVDDDISRLSVLYQTVGDVPIATFTIEDAERAMRALPERCREPATRRHYAQLLHRVLKLATYPLRLLSHNPLPEGFLPKPGKPKADQWLRVDEEERLVSSQAVPLCRRIYWGYLAREGMRGPSEAARLVWSNVDLERGTVTLDENKTSVPRAWVLGADVVRALKRWRKLRYPDAGEKAPPNELVFVDDRTGGSLEDERLADQFRKDLKAAGIERAELYVKNKARIPIRAHDLRATFATIALATGKTETWVMDRGGWTTSQMVNRYRRTARTASELGQTWLVDLEHALFGEPTKSEDHDSDAGDDHVADSPDARSGADPTLPGEVATVHEVPSDSPSSGVFGSSRRIATSRSEGTSLGSAG